MSDRVTLTVPSSLAGMRVDRAVATLSGLSRREISDLLAEGRLSMDGAVLAAGSAKTRAGSEIVLEVSEPRGPADLLPDAAVEVPVVYEDGDLVVVDKPAGLVVHPGSGVTGGTLVNGLLARRPELAALVKEGICDPARPGVVHRLDKGTSGLMVVALSARAFAPLSAAIARRAVQRGYSALVWGTLPDDAGVIDAPIGRSTRDRTLMALSVTGRAARTGYRVEQRFVAPVEATLLSCRLESGRTHQIRVHLSALGHPVAGDARYGGAVTRRRDPRGSLTLTRPFLHASRLAFAHPVTGVELEFTSPLPPDLSEILSVLRTSSGA